MKGNGFVEGENVTIVYRWAGGKIDRMPELASELVRRQVAVLVTAGDAGALAAKAATTVIPIVFHSGTDPVKVGLVASLARPGGNMTGVNFFAAEIAPKRLEYLRALVPEAVRVAALLNPANPNMDAVSRDLETAARAMGLRIQAYHASTVDEIDASFSAFARDGADALFVAGDPVFRSRRVQLSLLAAHYRLPASGVYVSRILKGAKAADLPVVQSSKFELVLNLQPARMLRLTVPSALLSTADEVIE